MCGRSCLTLSPAQIQQSCQYHKHASASATKDDAGAAKTTPEFRAEYNCGKIYTPSHNVAPTDVTPVLVSGAHFGDDEQCGAERVLIPMMWGIIPYWHRGATAKHGLTTNNCRLESMLTSKLYGPTFERGQRCVIVCEGFYEWRTTKEVKPSERDAYYFYVPQTPAKIKAEPPDVEDVKPPAVDLRGQQHHNLLKIAGLFDVWTDDKGDSLFSYSVITFESAENFAWLHHRSPAILESEQQVADWLDFRRVDAKQALRLLRPAETLEWHRVSNMVNNSRNKSEQCNKPIEMVQEQARSTNPLQAWLGKRKREPDLKEEE